MHSPLEKNKQTNKQTKKKTVSVSSSCVHGCQDAVPHLMQEAHS